MKHKLILIGIVLIGFLLRFYQLDLVPSGIYFDEASQGYNAYSILKTGKDEYGKSFPVFLRSFGYYASSLYAYLSTIPISFLGLTIFSTRLISAISGLLLIILTYLIVMKLNIKNKGILALVASFVVAISPWTILFSRGAFEANLALTIFVFAVYLFMYSLERKNWLILATIILSISTYAYQSERLVAPLFLIGFIWIFRNRFKENKILLISSIGIFLLIEIPQILIISSAGASIRFKQLSYINMFLGKNYSEVFLINYILIGFNLLKEFLSQYISYFSPRNIFFDSDPQLIRSIPNMSIFYSWMVIPFFLGIKYLSSSIKELKLFILILVLSPLPAALVSDPFSILRVLPLLWIFSLVISFGIYEAINLIAKKIIQIPLILLVVILMFLQLYSSYFVLLKHERSKEWGYAYKELFQKLENIDKQIIIEDNSGPAYIEYAFLSKFDPVKMQSLATPEIKKDYYNFVQFNKNIKLDNIEFRPIDYLEIEHTDQVIVIDPKAFSNEDAKSHRLEQIFQIKDKRGDIIFTIYKTHPKKI